MKNLNNIDCFKPSRVEELSNVELLGMITVRETPPKFLYHGF